VLVELEAQEHRPPFEGHGEHAVCLPKPAGVLVRVGGFWGCPLPELCGAEPAELVEDPASHREVAAGLLPRCRLADCGQRRGLDGRDDIGSGVVIDADGDDPSPVT
jgi:hypothetical protein